MLPVVLEVVQLQDTEAQWDVQDAYGKPASKPPAFGNMDSIAACYLSCTYRLQRLGCHPSALEEYRAAFITAKLHDCIFWAGLAKESLPTSNKEKGLRYRVEYFANGAQTGLKQAHGSLFNPLCHFARPSLLSPHHMCLNWQHHALTGTLGATSWVISASNNDHTSCK
eukprot:1157119-Pelagomonas_calceolata.AAC.6